jgi:Cu-Zn family superoxide dismutase
MKQQILIAGCVLLAAAAFGCGGDGGADATAQEREPVKRAIAYVNALGDDEFQGTAIFLNLTEQIELQVDLDPAPPGEYVVAIHETGNCDSEDGMSAGGIWSPAGATPAAGAPADSLVGYLGRIEVGDDGKGSLTLASDRWSLGTGAEDDILNLAVVARVVTEETDAQSTEAAGNRIGCGVIRPR